MRMKKVNARDLEPIRWDSPKGTYGGFGYPISEALGRVPQSTDLLLRHPFDVEILHVPSGKVAYPFHSHSLQWEFYYVLSGRGEARDGDGITAIEPGDAFLFKPGEAHQIANRANDELVIMVVADNPLNESTHYPDSNKWIVRSPERRVVRASDDDYYAGEE